MGLSLHTDHRMILVVPATIYLVLVVLVAILPARAAARREA